MDIINRQAALQAEADAAVVDLALATELASFGEPVRVGSSAMGLMSKPDVDLTVICPKLDGGVAQAVAQLGARLACHERVRQVTLRNDTGSWNSEPESRPEYGSTVRGVDIYRAVLDDRVLTASQFEEWLARRGLWVGRMSRFLLTLRSLFVWR
jgi:hypothetical protein